MPRRCCLGCTPTRGVLHVFPNPDKFPEQFKAWVRVMNGQDECNFNYKSKRICDRHFSEKDRNRNNRLNALAVPSLFLHGKIDEKVKEESSLDVPEADSQQSTSSKIDEKVKEESSLDVPEAESQQSTSSKIDEKVKEESSLDVPEAESQQSTSRESHGITATAGQSETKLGFCYPTTSTSLPSTSTSENATTGKSGHASSTVVDDPVLATEGTHTGLTVDVRSHQASEGFISCTSPIEDVPSPQASEGFISCLSPIVDVPSPQGAEVTISCTSPIVHYSPPKTTGDQRASHTGLNAFAVLKHTYSKFPLPEKINIAAPDAYNENYEKALLSISNYKRQQRQIKYLKQHIKALQKRCISYKIRLAEASKTSVAFQKVTKNMTEPAKLFMKMQCTQTHKKPSGRRFSLQEKQFSLLLYKQSPQYYSFLKNLFTLPSIKRLKCMLAQENLEPYLALDKNSTLPSNKTLVQEKLQPYLTLEKTSTLPPKVTLKEILPHEQLEPYLTLQSNSSLPLKITLSDILAHKQLPYPTLKENSTRPSKKTHAKEKPVCHLKKKLLKVTLAPENQDLDKNSMLPPKVTHKYISAHEQLEHFLTFKKNPTRPPKRTRAQEKPEPLLTKKKKSTPPPKTPRKVILAQEYLEPYHSTINKTSKTYLGKRRAKTETHLHALVPNNIGHIIE